MARFAIRIPSALGALTLRLCSLAASGVVVLIGLFVLREALPPLLHLGPARFVLDSGWHPQPTDGSARFGMVPMVAGTLGTTAIALLLAGPLGVLSAVWSCFYAPRALAVAFRRLLGLLTGIPSVVYGVWGLIVLVPLVRRLHPPGPSLLAGGLILAVMILPTVALLAESAVRSVPKPMVDGGFALGLGRWATVRGVVLPAARSGITNALLLATGRALGETMAVLMVAGNVVQMPSSPFDPVRTLTANIALEMAYAAGTHRQVLYVSGLLLLLIVALLVWLARTREALEHPDRTEQATQAAAA